MPLPERHSLIKVTGGGGGGVSHTKVFTKSGTGVTSTT